MIKEEIKNIKSEKKDLRNFGITFGVLFGLLSGLLWWKGKDTYTIFLILSMSFFLLGFMLPALLKPLQKAWMTFAVILGWFMTRLILSVLFYIVFTFIGVVARLFGKDFLEMHIDKSKDSHWLYRKQAPFTKENYEKQF